MRTLFAGVLGSLILAFTYSNTGYAESQVLTVGYFPNVTHAHALIAQSMEKEGKNWFENYLPGVKIQWNSFNAGPSAMEALFAGTVHVTYVGPSPVLNAFIRSRGGVSVVSGAVRGGAGLVVPKNSSLSVPKDFKGKQIATPQLGNTQDIACRYWFQGAGLKVTLSGGDVSIVPTSNPSILALFATKRIDAAWTVEPWLSRLEMESEGRLLYSEPAETSITTVLAVGTDYLANNKAMVDNFVKAHHALTQWIIENPEEAKQHVTQELSRQMRREFPKSLIDHAWGRLVFNDMITTENFTFSLKAAQAVGFLKGNHDLSKLVQNQ